MFAQGWRTYLQRMAELGDLPGDPREALRLVFGTWVDFFIADPECFALLCQRPIPGFQPSPESYAFALEALSGTGAMLAAIGITEERALDVLTALASGLISQQIANDPGGDRWARLVDDTVDMYLGHCRPTKRGSR